MRNSLLKHSLRVAEPLIVVLLLLYYFDPQLPIFFASGIKYISYGMVGLLLISVGMGRWQRFAYLVTRDIFPWLLLGLSLASSFWSAAPQYTLDEIDPLIGATCFGAYIAMRYSVQEIVKLMAWTLGLAAVLSFIYWLVFPDFSIDEGLVKGIFKHKQYLGRIMTIAVITFISLFSRKQISSKSRCLLLFLTAMALALIVLSQSKSSMLLIIVSGILFPLFYFLKQKYRTQVVIFIPIFILVASIGILIVNNLELIVVDILGKNMEFNGRTPVWTLAIEKGLERPWFGYGYSGFWTSDSSTFIINSTWAPSDVRFHAHNGFIDIFLQLGFVGLGLLIISFASMLIRTLRLIVVDNSRELFWLLQFLTIFFLANFSIVNTFLTSDTGWIIYVALSFRTGLLLERRYKQSKLSKVLC